MHVSNTRSLLAMATVSLAASLGASGCVDQEKCDEAAAVTRDALTKEQPALARQWRDRAYALCDDTTALATLDQEIVAKETEIVKREEDRKKQIEEAAQRRMKLAGSVWKKFSKLDKKQMTMENLNRHRDKADQMSRGLPDEYGKQINDYNAKQYDKLKRQVEKLEKKK